MSFLYKLTKQIDAEPLVDLCKCSECGKTFHIKDCKTEEDGDWENGYYQVHICPVCPNGGCIDDYNYSKKQYKKLVEWEKKILTK